MFVKIIEPKILRLAILDSLIYVQLQGMEQKIPINALGGGLSKIIRIFSHVYNNVLQFCLIDEIENGIYYDKIDELLQLLIKRQMKIKTNSLYYYT